MLFFKIEGFSKVFRQDRTDTSDGRGGGVLVYVKDNITATKIDSYNKHNFTNSILFSIETGSNDQLLVGVVYRSPNSNEDNNNSLYTMLEEALSVNPSAMIIGDFNFPGINWELLTSDNNGQRLLSISQDNFLSQHVCSGTRGDNIIDLVFTTEPTMVNEIDYIGKLGMSDHEVLEFPLEVKTKINPSSESMPDYNRTDFKTINIKLR